MFYFSDFEVENRVRYSVLTLESVACIGACGLAPCIMINDDTHGRLVPGDMKKILEQYE